MKLHHVSESTRIQVGKARLWEILSRYGDVSEFHGGVRVSEPEGRSGNEAGPDCQRVCHIVDMGLHITLKERITEFTEGESYRYEVYEWKNFPLRKMNFGFLIEPAGAEESILRIEIDYRAKPGWLTAPMAPKVRSLARGILLGYRHYAETGERRVPVKQLRRRYRDTLALEPAAFAQGDRP